jgi:hydrogenase expression/formation protein HypC
MCIAYPGQVLEITDGTALVETDQRRRRASLLLVPETAVGDWVVVSAGTVLRVLDPEEAEEIRAMLDEAARADAALRGVTPPDGG